MWKLIEKCDDCGEWKHVESCHHKAGRTWGLTLSWGHFAWSLRMLSSLSVMDSRKRRVFSGAAIYPVEKMIIKSQCNMRSGRLSESLHMNTCHPIREWTRPSRREEDKWLSPGLVMYFFMCWIILEPFPEAAGWLGFPPWELPARLSGWMIVCPFFFFFP